MILQGNALEVLKTLPDESVDCVVTSPPYYMLRDYGEETVFVWDGSPNCKHEWDAEREVQVRGDYSKANFCLRCGAWKGQLGLEPYPELYVKHLADIFSEVYRVLKKSGNLFINIGDTYASGGVNYGYAKQELLKENKGTWIREKQLLLIPYRLAIELQSRGWIIRDVIVWAKKVYSINQDYQFGNGLPESTKDRLTKAYEVIIHAVKSQRYYFNKPKTHTSVDYAKAGNNVYFGKFKDVNPESFGSIRARDLRYKGKLNGASSPSGRVARDLAKGKELTFVKKAIGDVNGYLKQKLKESSLSVEELSERTGIKKSTLEHYFRTDESGSALPSKEAWELLKPILGLCEYEERIKEEYKSVVPVLSPFAFIGNVLHCNTEPSRERHYALMPSKLVEFLIRAGCPENGLVLDPFGGAGTTAVAAERLSRKWIVVEASSEYIKIVKKRLRRVQKKLF